MELFLKNESMKTGTNAIMNLNVDVWMLLEVKYATGNIGRASRIGYNYMKPGGSMLNILVHNSP